MHLLSHPPRAIQYLYALLISIALVGMIDVFTNSMPAQWDGAYYVHMAKFGTGIPGDQYLVAPYAYRVGMPYLSHVVANLFSISTEDGFRIVGWLAAVSLLMSIFLLCRNFTADYRQALLPMVLLGLSWQHIKYPLFSWSSVDVAAYPLMVIAFWALITKRFWLCLMVSGIGLLFKEFLAIPWLLLVIRLAVEYWRSRSGRELILLGTSVVVGIALILIPRMYIPVTSSEQFIDPVHNTVAPGLLLLILLDKARWLNIIYDTAGYWLPTLLLLSRSRLSALRAELAAIRILPTMAGYLFLVLVLTIYGGANIFVFVSYTVALQAVVLALIFRHGVTVVEVVFVVAAMLVYNKTFLHIPLPTNVFPSRSFDEYIDFYGGWASRVNMTTLYRFLELATFVIVAAFVRWRAKAA